MTPGQRYDIAADSLALIDAAHRADEPAIKYLLDASDNKAVVRFLSDLAAELVSSLAAWNRSEPEELMATLRSSQLGGGGGAGRTW